jgi:hypothetical protein
MRSTIEMAREAGFFEDNGDGQGVWLANASCLKAFEALVRADEREACAKEADAWSKRDDDVGAFISKAIRARGETK